MTYGYVEFVKREKIKFLLYQVIDILLDSEFESKDCHEDSKPVRFGYKVGLAQLKKRSNTMLDVTINNEQKVTVTLTPLSASGKPAKLDGVPTWTVQSGESTVVAASDGLSAELISSDNPGDTAILVDADADLGSGVIDLQDTIHLHVLGANAANLGLTAGTPVPKA